MNCPQGTAMPLARRTLPDRIRKCKPLVPIEDLGDATSFRLTKHAGERCEARGIGIMEVYSAIADPDTSAPNQSGRTIYARGDIQVIVDVNDSVIVTVADIYEAERAEPRRPLQPNIPGGSSMAKSNGTFDEAWVLVPHSEPDVRIVEVSPALAEKMLATMVKNRRVKGWRKEEHKENLENGTMLFTHQGVAMDTLGRLQDGQHRLLAIAETGISAKLIVVVGMPPENFKVIDTGANRTYADVLGLEGHADADRLGTTLRLAHLYLNPEIPRGLRVTNATVLELVESDPEGFERAMLMGKHLNQGMFAVRTAAGAAFYVINRVNTSKVVNEFMDALATGAGIDDTGDPRLALRRLMSRTRKEGTRRSAFEQMALIIKTWNAWAEGRELRGALSWRRDEPMPRVTKLERKR